MSTFTIGKLSRVSGVKVTTIRFYEARGLLPPPDRSEGGQRRYGHATADRLLFIRRSRELGLGLDAIGEMLDLAGRSPAHPCDRAQAIARAHLSEVKRRIGALHAVRAELTRILSQLDDGTVNECEVIRSLQDHGSCLHDKHPSPA